MLMEMQKRISPYRDFLESKYINLLIIKFKIFLFGGYKALLYLLEYQLTLFISQKYLNTHVKYRHTLRAYI